ncbi:MAG: hypothetical protein PUE08_05555 [Eubacteriales bacterium]|nr:hypothetical protein [Eubacteriales bacterium]
MSFNFKGCIIKIDFYFILVMSFCALTGADDLIRLLIFSSLHEAGHLIMLLICRGKPLSLTFSYYGFALKYKDNLPKISETLVIASGPLVNLIFYFILKDDFNLILFFINILPAFPLDGGRIVKLYFNRVSKVVTIVALIFLYALSLYLIIYCESISMLLISLYLTIYSLNY